MDNIKLLKPSERGEYEITDLINIYITQNSCSNVKLRIGGLMQEHQKEYLNLENNLS